jgi:dolichol-phosphate mannosyltransferase
MTSPDTPLKTLVAVFVYNEGEKLRETLSRFTENRPYDIVIMDDGSTDNAREVIADFGFETLRHDTNQGVGAALRTVIRYADENGYDVLLPMAGNGKMHPSDIPNLLKPIIEDGYDFVQGSRYLPGGRSENLPLFRRIMIPLFTWIVRLVMGFKGTDITCGMRAYRLDILRHPRVDINQQWLGRYEMEYYIIYYTLRLGFKLTEAPVAMTYPVASKNYSKIRSLGDWWSMVRPWVLLTLRLRK